MTNPEIKNVIGVLYFYPKELKLCVIIVNLTVWKCVSVTGFYPKEREKERERKREFKSVQISKDD